MAWFLGAVGEVQLCACCRKRVWWWQSKKLRWIPVGCYSGGVRGFEHTACAIPKGGSRGPNSFTELTGKR